MRKISACHYTRCCHGNGLNPKIDNQNINLILTVLILVNHYGENLKRN